VNVEAGQKKTDEEGRNGVFAIGFLVLTKTKTLLNSLN
jgi:hypothetical protein